MNTPRPTGPGCSYIRVSDMAQEVERQQINTAEWAARHGVTIQRVYQDQGGRRHLSAQREDFQKLLRDLEKGLWSWVVVDAQDRLGFKDPFEYYHFIHVFRSHSVALYAATGDVLLSADDAAGILTTGVGAIGSRDEMVKKSQRDLGAKRAIAARGGYTGGISAFGCDIVCYEGESEVWRVVNVGKFERVKRYPDGTEERWDGRDNFPPKGKTQRLALAPSVMTDRIETLRIMFQWADEGESLNGIARRLNGLGRPHIHGPWYAVLVKGVLVNSAVIGRPAWNKRSSGIYSQIGNGGITAPTGKRCRKRDEADHIRPDKPIFEPLVPVEQFERVQAILSGAVRRPRKPRSDGLTLARLLWCGQCNTPLVGWHYNNRNSYACSSYRRFGKHNPHGCLHHHVSHDDMMAILDTYLAETESATGELKGADDRDLLPLLYRSKRVRERLATLRRRMEEYLARHLTEVAEVEPLAGGRSRYTVQGNKGPIVLELPDCDSPAALAEVFNWVNAGRRGMVAGRVGELRLRLKTLVRSYHELSPMARELVAADIASVEAELAGLEGDDLDIRERMRDAVAELIASGRAVSAARAGLAGGHDGGALIRRAVDRVVCWFAYKQCGCQTRSYLDRVEIYPAAAGDVVEVKTDKGSAIEDAPGPG